MLIDILFVLTKQWVISNLNFLKYLKVINVSKEGFAFTIKILGKLFGTCLQTENIVSANINLDNIDDNTAITSNNSHK